MSAVEVSESGRRLLRLARALCGYAANGATNADLARAVQTSAPNVTRTMAVLIAEGWARKDEGSGRFYPTSIFTRMTFAVTDDLNKLQSSVDDLRRSMTGR